MILAHFGVLPYLRAATCMPEALAAHILLQPLAHGKSVNAISGSNRLARLPRVPESESYSIAEFCSVSGRKSCACGARRLRAAMARRRPMPCFRSFQKWAQCSAASRATQRWALLTLPQKLGSLTVLRCSLQHALRHRRMPMRAGDTLKRCWTCNLDCCELRRDSSANARRRRSATMRQCNGITLSFPNQSLVPCLMAPATSDEL